MKRSEIKKTPLADTVIEALEPEDKAYRVNDGNGLYLRVKPNGAKSWELRYRKPDGKWSWAGIGPYGKGTHQYTGAKARAKAKTLLSETEDGQTVVATKRMMQAQQRQEAADTFEALAMEWHAMKSREWTAGTSVRSLGALRNHVFPVMGKRPFAKILPGEWYDLFAAMKERGIAEQTRRTRQLCVEIYDWAVIQHRIDFNPLDRLAKFVKSRAAENYARVDFDELPDLLRAIRSYQTPDVSLGLRLYSHLAVRPTELRAALWEEFDLDGSLWSVPAGRMKRRRDFLVPLSRQAVALLRELHEITGRYTLLFPSRSRAGNPRSDMVFTMALKRLGFGGRQTVHGFRHLFSTWAHEQGYEHAHIEASLSHFKENTTAGSYNKAQYLEQRRVLMQAWSDYLDSLVERRP